MPPRMPDSLVIHEAREVDIGDSASETPLGSAPKKSVGGEKEAQRLPSQEPIPLVINQPREIGIGDHLNKPLFGRSRKASFDGQDEDLTSVLPRTSFIEQTTAPLQPVSLDLSKQTRMAFLLGRGNTGKTTVTRLCAEIAERLNGDYFAAACDPGARVLVNHLKYVQSPETNHPADIAAFAIEALKYASSSGVSGIIDMGAGGEETLLRIDEQFGFLDLCKKLGIVPVFLYTVATGVNDLSVLKTFQERGLCAKATALIFNEMTVPAGMSRSAAFDLIRRQTCVRAALAAGAPEIWLPALDRQVFVEIERRGLSFGGAASGKSSLKNSIGRRQIVRSTLSSRPIKLPRANGSTRLKRSWHGSQPGYPAGAAKTQWADTSETPL